MTSDISTLDFVAFDTETTGLSPISEALVEVAAVKFDLLTGPKEYFQTLVNPGKPIPWQAARIHGITDEMVFTAPSTAEVMPHFFRFLEGSVPLAHNAPFDLGFLGVGALRAGLLPPALAALDSCQLSRRVRADLPSHRLEALVREFSLPSSTFHRAQADAIHCAGVFRHLVGESCGINASWEQLISIHGSTHSFQDNTRPLTPADAKEGPVRAIFEALERGKSLWIRYEGSYGPREVTPLLLYAKRGQQYMEATCHLDGAKKSFRVDRIKQIVYRPEENR
jgi:DNA polymerase III subunit epsilon